MTALRNAAPAGALDERARTADPASGRWSQVELLLAQTIDAVNRLGHLYTLVNTSGSNRPEPPAPVPRPGVPRKGAAHGQRRGRLSPAGAAALAHLITSAPAPAGSDSV